MIFDSSFEVFRVAVTGAVIYIVLIVVLRLSGKRTLAKLNAFDLVVTVALGSTLATVLTSADVSWSESITAIVMLVVAQFLVAWGSTRWRAVRQVAKSAPATLLRDGCVDHAALDANRITISEVEQAVRMAGYGSLDRIAAVVLETDGTFSIVSVDRAGDGSALLDDAAGE
jgi:uncharacterized membrane protein YcaP (DUF421 family)